MEPLAMAQTPQDPYQHLTTQLQTVAVAEAVQQELATAQTLAVASLL
jgi:hypothetical protein